MGIVIDVPISVGELIDKITILEIKVASFAQPDQRANVATELAYLQAVVVRHGFDTNERLVELRHALKRINEALWVIEERIRQLEQTGQFNSNFIELARSIYRSNDERARIKRQINVVSGSALIEEKSY